VTPARWQQVKRVVSDACERPAGDRAAFVAFACGGDEELKREVSSLVASIAASEGRFEVPPQVSLTGRRVGAYEILDRIGAGGMGEVYRARDARLDRIVAIKVLPAGVSSDPVSREQIAREARAVAALSHPNICTVHDIGSHDGVDYFVMEFVHGESLATRLSRGALPLGEVLRYAEQIAAALVEAHRAGIVHRDVKPANIMLQSTPRAPAQVKLLDFGIAKAKPFQATSVGCGAGVPAAEPSVDGFVVGTAHYMAPEQLEGLSVDPRTDIFAFGAVLFEMLTGRKAFGGTNREEALTAIRSGGARVPSAFRAQVPAALDRLVVRCLARRPEDRYQTGDDLLVDLRASQRRLDSSRRAIAVAAVVLLAATGGLLAYGLSARSTSAPPALTTSLIRLPASAGVIGAPALSLDGSRLVFAWVGDGFDNPELMLLPVGSTSKTRLTRNIGVEEWPVWSPDGTEIAFIRCIPGACGIFALRIEDGVERRIRELPSDRYYALAWSPDGRSLVYGERPSTFEPYALFELSLHDSSARRLTTPPRGEMGDLRFAFSPDGRALAIIRLEPGGPGVYILSLATGTEKAVLQKQQEWLGGVTWSRDGRHLIVSANQRGVRHLWRLPVDGGGLEPLAMVGEDAYYPSVYGTRLVFVRSVRDWDLSRVPLSGGKLQAPVSFPSSTRPDLDPAFSPDGRKLAFVSERSGSRELWLSDADGSSATPLTSRRGTLVGRPSWSPDGRFIAFHGPGIQVMSADGRSGHQLSDDGERPTWSADGASIYFIRNRGRFSVWKVPAMGGTAEEVPAHGASAAREAPESADLYFLRQDGIWRQSRATRQETRVIGDSTFWLPAYWAVMRDGIYYVQRSPGPNSTWMHRLRFHDFARARVTDLGPLPGRIDDWVGGLTVSPDRRTVVYSHGNYESSEIMLVEQFR
jgi:serine/threonine protein kinase/Tol biopolymer transport system component